MANSPARFMWLRSLRIFPALAVVVAFETFVVGPIFYGGSALEYITQRGSWAHLKNVSLFWGGFTIPGVFENNPLRGVNGSTWTLPVEFTLYALAMIAAASGLLHRKAFPTILIAAGALFVYSSIRGFYFPGNVGPELVNKVAVYPLARWGTFFALGAAMWVYRERIVLDPGIAFCALFALIISKTLWDFTYFVCGAYLTIYIALACRPVMSSFFLSTDVSYGLYIFAWPVQQWIIATIAWAMNPWLLALVALPISMLIGFASWNLIEKPALRLRHWLPNRRPHHSPPTTSNGGIQSMA